MSYYELIFKTLCKSTSSWRPFSVSVFVLNFAFFLQSAYRNGRMDQYKLLIKLSQGWWNQSAKGWKFNLCFVIILFLFFLHFCYREVAYYSKASSSTKAEIFAIRLGQNSRHGASVVFEMGILRFWVNANLIVLLSNIWYFFNVYRYPI